MSSPVEESFSKALPSADVTKISPSAMETDTSEP